MLKYLTKAILLLSLIWGASSVSVSAEEAQRAKLQGTIDAALNVIYSDCCASLSDEEKQAKVRQTIEASYDLDVIIRRAIGRNWGVLSPREQGEVLELVKQLVLKAYVKGLKGKGRPQVTLGEVTTTSEGRMEIESKIFLDGKTFYVLYRLRKMQSGWQIYDIVAENVSVVSNYREQLDDHFRKGTGAELITRLKELLQQDEINEDTKI
ncbi:ABC transporter substrate-binding protein [Coraliomargarita sp. SDUM461003]|uniref:ABC transporter substrate-binding protein n=1 Tax=Thalassobacterium maritimum TaxID=3041265 RepID=A0ABU1AUL2_9BACT|nr:ABC transporter substrate-binding protein [Coraliomargarita sp. SDUM461003]MDQ8206810.1 ABC transporter substrate-binding protein [Coraliomargarita sp. SDUM461003]